MKGMIDGGITKILDRLERRSRQEKARKVDILPDRRMLAITKETGQLINIILLAIGAKHVLEIGTSTGYSALWCADIVRRNSGIVITIERNRGKIVRAAKNFADAGVSKSVRILEGEASNVLKELAGEKKFHEFFDFVLIDADKENAIRYFDLAAPLLRRGGIIMTDNMTHPEKYNGMMRKFARHVKANTEFQTVTCPIGNGEEISVKV